MKRTGKGLGLDIHPKGRATRTGADYTTAFNKFKAEMAKTPTPPATFDWKPYKPAKAMTDAIERCKELTAWPSRYA